MNDIFLTDSIHFKDNVLYFDNIKITKNNWHNKLDDFGWFKLNINWIKKLNKLSLKKSKNSSFGCLDCGADGECLFNCISFALNNYKEIKYNSKYLRELIANKIDKCKYDEIINIYRILKDSDDFDEEWNPYKMTYKKFLNIIKKGGDNFWADIFLIDMIKNILDINIIILNSDDINNIYENYSLLHNYEKNKKTIILLYENNLHFKLVGYFIDYMVVLFTQETLPDEIKLLLNV